LNKDEKTDMYRILPDDILAQSGKKTDDQYYQCASQPADITFDLHDKNISVGKPLIS